MKHPATVVAQRSEFDRFLFAPIGEEKIGMLLSVLSALARLDLDPWREAAELARMPKHTAKQRLTSLIEALPDSLSTRPEPETISTRLFALLPRGASSSIASSKTLPVAGAKLNIRGAIYVLAVYLLFAAQMMAAQLFASSLHPSPKIESAQASTASEVRPLTSSPGPTR
jgi:hypothetical protein